MSSRKEDDEEKRESQGVHPRGRHRQDLVLSGHGAIVVVVVAGNWLSEPEQNPGEGGADDGPVDEVDGEGNPAEPEKGWMRKALLGDGREHHAHCNELDADAGPVTELLDALGEDGLADTTQICGPLCPVALVFGVSGKMETDDY